jgi:hypothetical protein
MTATTTNLSQITHSLQQFTGADLTATLARLEGAVKGRTVVDCGVFLEQHHVGGDALAAAGVMKTLFGQINVVIHALGILRCLPHILEPGETVDRVSLGAGNTGRAFDLETDRRVAEFKFIRWRGGAETIRQNGIFKDFFQLAAADNNKRKYLYVLGTEKPLKFLRGGRAMDSVLSKNVTLKADFAARYGDQHRTVRDYYRDHHDKVIIIDVLPWLPELAGMPDEDE